MNSFKKYLKERQEKIEQDQFKSNVGLSAEEIKQLIDAMESIEIKKSKKKNPTQAYVELRRKKMNKEIDKILED